MEGSVENIRHSSQTTSSVCLQQLQLFFVLVFPVNVVFSTLLLVVSRNLIILLASIAQTVVVN